AEMPDLGPDRLRHAADEHRQPDADRDGLALRREQTGGEVECLVDDDVVSGAHEVGLHFLGHRDDAVAHDLRDHGVDLARGARRAPGARLARDSLCPFCHGAYRPPAATLIIRCPQASTSSLSPGNSTVVAACSSVSAGPLVRVPTGGAARAEGGGGGDLAFQLTGRLPVKAALSGALFPRATVSCGGLRMMPVTVLRRLTISARSSGAEVP